MASLKDLFWTNPEYIRHRRAELRPARAITAALVVIVICGLIGLACWSFQESELARAQAGLQTYGTEAWKHWVETIEKNFAQKTWLLFYRWLIGIQGIALTFWALFSCAQSVSGERDRKTWEFQRTTRLTSAEILTGKLLGEPVLLYFSMLCATPITILAGIAGGLSVGTVLSVWLFFLTTALLLGLAGMWLSTLLESRTRGVGLIGALGIYGAVLAIYGMRESGLPGMAALSPLSAIINLLGADPSPSRPEFPPMLFGREVPWIVMNLLLCVSIGTWLVVMLVRNLKRDYPEIRPLSRWQAVGCAAFLNFLIYALLRPASLHDSVAGMARQGWFTDAKSVAVFAVAMNGLILFLMGLATLTPQERLKVWQRRRNLGQSRIFADDGLAWPWLGMSAVVAYGLMIWGLLAWDRSLPLESRTLQTAAVQLLLVAVFVTRDVLFLQWCMLTRLRQPVVKGFMFLCLYYAAAAVIATLATVTSANAGSWAVALLTPAGVFDPKVSGAAFPAAIYVGLLFQMGVIGTIKSAISSRLQRPAQAGAAA
jgi:ABC-2 family transporter